MPYIKKTADFIRCQAKHYGISKGMALENMLDGCPVDEPDLGAVLSVINVEFILKNQTEEQKTQAMFIVAGALLQYIIETNKYTVDEALEETVKNLHEFRRIVNDISKKANEE